MQFFFKYYRAEPLPPTPWELAPLLRYACWVIGGILVAWLLRDYLTATLWMIALAICFFAMLLSYWEGRLLRHRFRTGVLALAIVGLTAGLFAAIRMEQIRAVWPVNPEYWAGKVERVHKLTSYGVQTDVRLTDGPNLSYREKIVRLTLNGKDAQVLQPGNELHWLGVIAQPKRRGNPGDFDYRTYLLTHGISGTAYLDDAAWKSSQQEKGRGLRPFFLAQREKLLAQYRRYFSNEHALEIISALTLGDKTMLSEETRSLFSETGTSHVLALSGLHLSILFGCVLFFYHRWLFYRPRWAWIVSIFVWAALWAFVFLVGAPLSLQRAAWMFSLMLVGLCKGRNEVATLNNLCFAVILILLVDPLALFDVGFQMSVMAVLSITLMNIYVWRRYHLPIWDTKIEIYLRQIHYQDIKGWRRWLHPGWRKKLLRPHLKHAYVLFNNRIWPFITVSLSAQLGTAPLVAYYFHGFASYAFFANFIVIPCANILLFGALLFFIIPLEAVRTLCAFILQATIGIMTGALSWFADLPGSYIPVYLSAWTLLMCWVIPLVLYIWHDWKYKVYRRRALLIAGGLFISAVCLELYRMRPGRVEPQLIVYNIPRTSVVHFIASADSSYLLASVPPDSLSKQLTYINRNFFRPNRMRQPRVLTGTKFAEGPIAKAGSVVRFGSEMLVLLRQSLSHPNAAQPMQVSTLVVGRGCRNDLKELLQAFQPRRLVLDSSLTPYYRERLIAQCRAARIPCHDVKTDGAFRLPISSTSN